MSFHNNYSILLIVICSLPQYGTLGQFTHDLNVLHVGDQIEAELGVAAACKTNSRGRNITGKILEKFSLCLAKTAYTSTQFLNHFSTICKTQNKHLKCWNLLRKKTLRKCGNDKVKYIPRIFQFTLLSFCKNDKGATAIHQLEQAGQPEFSPDGGTLCTDPYAIFRNYNQHCIRFLPKMTSPDECTRHRAIGKCVKNMISLICPHSETNTGVYQAYGQIYWDARHLLNCGRNKEQTAL